MVDCKVGRQVRRQIRVCECVVTQMCGNNINFKDFGGGGDGKF